MMDISRTDMLRSMLFGFGYSLNSPMRAITQCYVIRLATNPAEKLVPNAGFHFHMKQSRLNFIKEVEETTGVPASYIIKSLGLPASMSEEERLGPLKRQYGFEINDVREIVTGYKNRE